jgi:hypothetical protein
MANRLTQQQVRSILQLDNPRSIGDIIESLATVYARGQHQLFNTQSPLPEFLKRSIGPQLEYLPSYTRSTDRTEHPELLARRGIQGLPGLGEAMEVTHTDMRQMGAKIGRIFASAIRAAIPRENLTGTFQTGEVMKLEALDGADITLSKDLPPLKVEADLLVHNAFLLGAVSRDFLPRKFAERSKIDANIGNAKRALNTMLDQFEIIEKAMAKDPAYKGKTLADFGLALDTDAHAKAFCDRQQEFAATYNYLYTVTGGELDPRLQSLKWAIEGTQRPPAGIQIRSGAEAAAALAGLHDLAESNRPRKTFLYDEMARQSELGAAALMKKSGILDQLRTAPEMQKPGIAEFTATIIGQLQEFQQRTIDHFPLRDRPPAESPRAQARPQRY